MAGRAQGERMTEYRDLRGMLVDRAGILSDLATLGKTEAECEAFFGELWREPGFAVYVANALASMAMYCRQKK